MKKKMTTIVLALGWVLFLLVIISNYLVTNLSGTFAESSFAPINWSENFTAISKTLACSLTSEELVERKELLKKEIFSQVRERQEQEDGFLFFFDDQNEMDEKIMEFIRKEKQCCPFFKYDLSILPYSQGLALKVSGGKKVKEFLRQSLELI